MGCTNCSADLALSQVKYCSNKCQSEYQYSQYIQLWKYGEVNGSRGSNAIGLSKHLVRYLKEKYQNKCRLCAWSEVNLSTNSVPLEIDHIDGDANNNAEENPQLLCPNCHSLTANYRNLNIGHGRAWRREKYVRISKLPI